MSENLTAGNRAEAVRGPAASKRNDRDRVRAARARAAIRGLADVTRFFVVEMKLAKLVDSNAQDAILLNLAVAVGNLDDAAERITPRERARVKPKVVE